MAKMITANDDVPASPRGLKELLACYVLPRPRCRKSTTAASLLLHLRAASFLLCLAPPPRTRRTRRCCVPREPSKRELAARMIHASNNTSALRPQSGAPSPPLGARTGQDLPRADAAAALRSENRRSLCRLITRTSCRPWRRRTPPAVRLRNMIRG
ncbi:hypothetical protein VPH35_132128 [Triticum aestivum]